jgi:outer membrane protein OmpA-like peptidoglycan-associated protein
MVSGAAGDVSSIEGGLRVTFGAGKADMSPATVAALHSLAQALAPNPLADVNIYAYAAGAPDDPSTPRRLSLSRALAARAVLMSDGIASTRIYVHALGSTASPGPPDRVDVQLAGSPK